MEEKDLINKLNANIALKEYKKKYSFKKGTKIDIPVTITKPLNKTYCNTNECTCDKNKCKCNENESTKSSLSFIPDDFKTVKLNDDYNVVLDEAFLEKVLKNNEKLITKVINEGYLRELIGDIVREELKDVFSTLYYTI